MGKQNLQTTVACLVEDFIVYFLDQWSHWQSIQDFSITSNCTIVVVSCRAEIRATICFWTIWQSYHTLRLNRLLSVFFRRHSQPLPVPLNPFPFCKLDDISAHYGHMRHKCLSMWIRLIVFLTDAQKVSRPLCWGDIWYYFSTNIPFLSFWCLFLFFLIRNTNYFLKF